MKKIITKISFGLFLAVMLGSCTDDFDEVNTDPKNFGVDALTQVHYPLIVKRALYMPHYTAFSNPGAGRGPFQLIHSLFTDVYANYFATSFSNFDSDQFFLEGRWLNGGYRYFYTQVATNILNAENTATEFGLDTENAMMKVWRVYAYHRMTDLWGPIPYSNFGNLESTVPYDSQQDIYADFFTTLDEAVAVLQPQAGTTSFLETADIIYGGNIDSWLKFTNTLRLRLAMRIRYADAAKAQAEAEKAVAAGVMLTSGDAAYIVTTKDFTNPYTSITKWGEFRISADIESILKGYEDPRIQGFADEAVTPDPTDDPAGIAFPWEGMQNGQTKADKNIIKFNEIASDMADPFRDPDGAGPNIPVLRASEAYLLRAEGALIGWNMGGTAQELYEQGVNTSHAEAGYDGNDLSGNPYVTSANVPAGFDSSTPAVSTVPIAYDAGATTERQLEQIITQKWIALFPDSEEAYAERRRTGYPTLYDRVNSINSSIAVDEIPRRMTYVSSEYDENGDAVQAAISDLLGGPDNGTTKLWWDKK